MTATISAADYLKRISATTSKEELEAVEHELFGRKEGVLTVALKGLGNLEPDQRKTVASELNATKKELQQAIDDKLAELGRPSDESLQQSDTFDMTLNRPAEPRGHLHLIPEFILKVEEVFGRMGFDTAHGPEIETEEMNFDKLNFPKDHAARDAQDIFFIDRDAPADNKWLLRAHTSPVQIRYMEAHKPPFRAIFPGKVYRKDADATHSPMFHQFEGLMIGKDVTLGNMKAIMETAVCELIDAEAEFRWRTGYFPFVEPGLEMDMRWQGDDSASREGKWLEICGCGMVHPNVLKNVNIDPEEWQGFAFGFGIERMIMIRHQIPDLRAFYDGDLRFLNQF